MPVVAIVSAVVLAGTAFAAVTNVSGYEALKQSAFASMEHMNNATMEISMETYADGTKIFGNYEYSEINTDQNAYYSRSENFNAPEGITWWSEQYRTSEDMYTSGSHEPDVYRHHQLNYGYTADPSSKLTDSQKKLVSIVMDLLVGDVKNYFVSDGSTISIQLSQNQIPEIVQSLLAVSAEAALQERSLNRYYTSSSVDSALAEYLYEPVVESGSLTATLSPDGYPEKVDMRIDLSGKNESGASHDAYVMISGSFRNVGSTVVRIFDPAGKMVVEPSQAWETEKY